MESSLIESGYPISFHEKEASAFGEHLKNRHSVVLLGMKRVGISNFLRFFLNHKDITKTYIGDSHSHLFIPVDLNDLVEREITPFWILTLKRIADAVQTSNLSSNIKKSIEALFLDSIQSQDLFLTIDSVRKSIMFLVEQGVIPTVFFIMFDRMKDAVTPEFFANLQGIRDASGQKLSYVFTSFRSLDILAPHVFPKTSLVVFSHNMYLRPLKHKDVETIYKTYKDSYELVVPEKLQSALFELVDGYVRYLHLSLIHLNENRAHLSKTKDELFSSLVKDERIALQSEELWESLTEKEQEVLSRLGEGKQVSKEDREDARYLWETGFVSEDSKIFSPLLEYFLKQKGKKGKSDTAGVDFTKKEHVLFSLLKDRMGEICEREEIIEKVWPEVEALGVSDWAIDRLVARVRNKLKQQKSDYEILTIKTRGYKLMHMVT